VRGFGQTREDFAAQKADLCPELLMLTWLHQRQALVLHASAIYYLLENEIVPMFYARGNDGVWISYKGQKWISAGKTVPFEESAFVRVGEYGNFLVFRRAGVSEDLIYVPTREGMLAPYRLKAGLPCHRIRLSGECLARAPHEIVIGRAGAVEPEDAGRQMPLAPCG